MLVITIIIQMQYTDISCIHNLDYNLPYTVHTVRAPSPRKAPDAGENNN